jgi:hypothetical protein
MEHVPGLELARVPRVPGTRQKSEPLASADFEVLNTNWHSQSSFYVTRGTLSFKFLTQALCGFKNDHSGPNVLIFL